MFLGLTSNLDPFYVSCFLMIWLDGLTVSMVDITALHHLRVILARMMWFLLLTAQKIVTN